MKWLDRFAIAVFILTMAVMLSMASDFSKNRRVLNQARAEFHSDENLEIGKMSQSDLTAGINSPKNEFVQISQTEKKFNDMLELNPDYVGWIEIPGTAIDYPVVKGRDNVFYLHNGFDGKRNVSGSIFMDCRDAGDGTDRNMIIYGHNMKNGTMFKDLMKYKNMEFLKDNRIILFAVRDGVQFWEIFSVYVTDIDFNFIKSEFTQDSFEEFKGIVAAKSMHSMNVDISEAQVLLTLSTCSYEFPDARFVVHARLIEFNNSFRAR